MGNIRSPSARRRARGQSIVEFALIFPLLLAFLGASLDFARVFQVWIALESATRDGAEAAATTATTSSEAASTALATVCAQTAGSPGYVASGTSCTQPDVTISSFSRRGDVPGASSLYPIATVTVTTSIPFRTLFAYPYVTQDGAWTVRASSTYSIVQGRVP